ncbi:uncharacterized protein LOC108596623 [Drosophila busckii]|uniref:uncharacterized protein LOC108596623 n=1 Tax=Drosophila busckii TaxID=30019 RepID=UPI0014332FEE|nr:uncharacterized protein LOC108596623 [Drosophila busckii]
MSLAQQATKPLLLDRHCLIDKIQKLLPLIKRIDWRNNIFRASWNYYANGAQSRQCNMSLRCKQQREFITQLVEEPSGKILQLLSHNLAPDASSSIYDEFLKCFYLAEAELCSCPVKRRKRARSSKQIQLRDLSLKVLKEKATTARRMLQNTRNPYDVEQLTQEIAQLEQLQAEQAAKKLPDRFIKQRPYIDQRKALENQKLSIPRLPKEKRNEKKHKQVKSKRTALKVMSKSQLVIHKIKRPSPPNRTH